MLYQFSFAATVCSKYNFPVCPCTINSLVWAWANCTKKRCITTSTVACLGIALFFSLAGANIRRSWLPPEYPPFFRVIVIDPAGQYFYPAQVEAAVSHQCPSAVCSFKQQFVFPQV